MEVTCADLRELAASDPPAALAHWLAADPDPVTREALAGLPATERRARLATRLAFGTAGLRAPVGAGATRMNRAVVRQTTAGVVDWLTTTHGRPPTVVVGHDARHGSAAFAADTAAVVAAAGGRALVLPPHAPTPLVAFAVRHLAADAGVQVTASHNPPDDNGYKLYLADGAQLPPPHDTAIAARIDAAALAPAVATDGDPGIVRLDGAVEVAYRGWLATLARDLCGGVPDGVAGLRLVHTAMHGVGTAPLLAAFAHVGLPEPTTVAAQAEPDPDFPTVAFPNPEEPGALDLALALAAEVDADLVLANDPDVDRLAVAVRPAPGVPATRRLTGDELGVLLADHVLSHTRGDDRLTACTVVSSGQLARLAAHHGVRHAETLTGFKWIVRPGLATPEARMVFGYEEAIGYAIGDGVRDKDGIGAAVAVVVAAAAAATRGSSLAARLDELAAITGLHLTTQVSRRYAGGGADAARDAAMAAVRAEPPARLADRPLVASEDLARGERLPPTDAVLLRYGTADDPDLRVVVRPSGTEPKIKVYVEVRGPAGAEAVDARAELQAALTAAATTLDAWLAGVG